MPTHVLVSRALWACALGAALVLGLAGFSFLH
jgi:hypothetical protein